MNVISILLILGQVMNGIVDLVFSLRCGSKIRSVTGEV